jgi:hypothetical protein
VSLTCAADRSARSFALVPRCGVHAATSRCRSLGRTLAVDWVAVLCWRRRAKDRKQEAAEVWQGGASAFLDLFTLHLRPLTALVVGGAADLAALSQGRKLQGSRRLDSLFP